MASFGFGSALPLDQVQLPQSGGYMPDPTQAPMPAPMPQPAPDPQSAPQPAPQQGYQPSKFDIFMDALFNNHSIPDAALKVRQRDYAIMQQQMMMDALHNASPEMRAAMMLNPGETGKALADRLATHTLSGGQTLVNGGPGGAPFTATLYGMDDKSGKGYGLGPDGLTAYGPSLGGDYSAKDGLVLSGRTGDIANRYALPQIVGPGQSLKGMIPGVSTPTLNKYGAGPAPQGGSLDPIGFFNSFVLPHEGALNPSDMNGAPTKYGINQSANPGVNVPNLKPEQAAQIFRDKYFGPSGAANMPPALAAVHADTYFINPKMANAFLQQSGGDPQAYLALRQNWMDQMAKTNPKAVPYQKAWAQRNADLGRFIAQAGGQGGQGADASGSTVQNLATGSEPRPMSPAERQQWGIPTSDPRQYMVGPDGKPAPIAEASYGPKDVASQRAEFYKSPEYSEYVNTVTGANNIETLLHSFTKNNSVVDQAALDNAIRNMTGLSAKNQNVVNFTEHLGLPDQLKGAIQQKFGNGYLSPDVLMGIRTMVRAYANGHRPTAEQRLASETAFAKSNNQDFGVQLPNMMPQEPVKWLDRTGKAQATVPEVGEVRGGYRFRGGNPASPQSWTKAQ